eukprot:CAMPEP_0202956836 /NCGR_PEP_ID=MMETSP1396-20130829/1329_1 /ASSEMBLY_ACC=CAM_ASM_000872 /TAXON_ID= /ORGANISM="Pseudokeronopsis sp., Strain Brazil" /LENGTH=76 /DNA_ID=CAMNT_0049674039 /DNA_START=610 /DNA_END=840 /DNA_ORIENTATION=-
MSKGKKKLAKRKKKEEKKKGKAAAKVVSKKESNKDSRQEWNSEDFNCLLIYSLQGDSRKTIEEKLKRSACKIFSKI